MASSVVKKLGSELGLRSPEKICRKADELMRLSEIKCNAGNLSSLGFHGNCRAIMCIELAASLFGEQIDKKEALKLSGMTNSNYKTSLKTLERLLDMEKKFSLKDLTVQFGCVEALDMTQTIFNSYVKEHRERTKSDSMDFNIPLFTSTALCAACKKMKIKIDKSKVVEVAGVRKATFDRLLTEMQKHADDIKDGCSKTSGKRSKTWLDGLDKLADENGANKQKDLKQENDDEGELDYEEWKRRILAQTEPPKT